MTEPKTILQRDVLARPGWTKTLLRKLLGAADATKRRPGGGHYTFYQLARVKQAEQDVTFAAAQAGIVSRREAGKRAADTKRKELLGRVEAVEISVPRLAEHDLWRHASKHYEALWTSRGQDKTADYTPGDAGGEVFRARITVNYLRHTLTNYERQLASVYGRTGAVDARSVIRRRILDAIARAYPALKAECERQLENRAS
jgi:hypothetical protein